MNIKGTKKGVFSKPARLRSPGTWIFGITLLLLVLAVFVFASEQLPAYKQCILALVAAGLSGFFGLFLTGSIGLRLDSLRSMPDPDLLRPVRPAQNHQLLQPKHQFRQLENMANQQGADPDEAECGRDLGQRH